MGLFVLMMAPYIDKNPATKPDDRKFAICLFTFFLMFWAVLVIIGSFFRGPGFNFVYPWKAGRLLRPLAQRKPPDGSSTVLLIAIPVLLGLAVLFVVATTISRQRSSTGSLGREARKADRAAPERRVGRRHLDEARGPGPVRRDQAEPRTGRRREPGPDGGRRPDPLR